jgi:hypothetical protein
MRAYSKRQRPFWLVVTGVVAALVLGFAFAQLAVGATPSSPTTDRCQTIFAGPLAKYPPTKRAYAQRVVQQCEAAREKPQPPKNPHYVPPASPPMVWRSGIIEQGSLPFTGGYYAGMTNQWQELVEGMHVNVYPGSYGDAGPDPGQGLVVVFATSPDFSFQSSHTWLASPHVGALHIVTANGHVLTLLAANGDRFTFDAVPACGMHQPATTGDECQFVPVSMGK